MRASFKLAGRAKKRKVTLLRSSLGVSFAHWQAMRIAPHALSFSYPRRNQRIGAY